MNQKQFYDVYFYTGLNSSQSKCVKEINFLRRFKILVLFLKIVVFVIIKKNLPLSIGLEHVRCLCTLCSIFHSGKNSHL